MTYPHFHTTKISDTRQVRWVVDTDHVPDYGLDTEEETQAAIDEEYAALYNGNLVALGAIAETKCKACDQWEEVDSLWGIVVEPNTDKLDDLAPEMSNFPDEQPDVFRILETLAECAEDISPNEARRRFFAHPFIDALDAARSIIKATKGKP